MNIVNDKIKCDECKENYNKFLDGQTILGIHVCNNCYNKKY